MKFYDNLTNLLATVPAPGHYTTVWTPPAAGVYNVTAQVAYNTTNKLNTASNKLTVSLPLASSVTISNITSTTISYAAGAGTQFVPLKSANAAAALSTSSPRVSNRWTEAGAAVCGKGRPGPPPNLPSG